MPIAHVEEDPEENSKGVRMMTIYVVLTWDAHVEEDPEEDSKGDELEDGCHEDRGPQEVLQEEDSGSLFEDAEAETETSETNYWDFEVE